MKLPWQRLHRPYVPTAVSDREFFPGKSYEDTVIVYRRRRHLRVYTVNTSVCPDQGATLLRRPPLRHRPNPSFLIEYVAQY